MLEHAFAQVKVDHKHVDEIDFSSICNDGSMMIIFFKTGKFNETSFFDEEREKKLDSFVLTSLQ